MSLNPQLTDLLVTIDNTLSLYAHSKDESHEEPEVHSKLKDIFYDKIVKIASDSKDPLFAKTLNTSLHGLDTYIDIAIENPPPPEAIAKIKSIKESFFARPQTPDSPSPSAEVSSNSSPKHFDFPPSASESGYATPQQQDVEKMAYIDQLDTLQKTLDLPANQRNELNLAHG